MICLWQFQYQAGSIVLHSLKLVNQGLGTAREERVAVIKSRKNESRNQGDCGLCRQKGRMELMRRSSKCTAQTTLRAWECMVRWQSNVTPRFLTELERETEAFPIDRILGGLVETDFLPDEITMTSVLSSFNFSLLLVIHDFTSVTHASMD